MVSPDCPGSSLRESLDNRKVPQLWELAKSYYIKGYSRMKKAALMEAVHAALLDAGRLTEIAYVTGPASWALFQRAAVDGLAFVDADTPTSP